MFGLIKSVAILAAAFGAVQATDIMNGYQARLEKGNRLSVNAQSNLPVSIDAGWYSFPYGSTGTIAYRSFAVSNSQVVQLELQSCFCPGNYFSVYDNGQPIIMSKVDTTNPDPLTCTPNILDPNTCAEDRIHFSYGLGLLLPGSHNITIVVRESPYRGGTAFIRVDTVCTQPDDATNPLDAFSLKPCCIQTNTCSTKIVA